MNSFIERIEIYPERQPNGQILKHIEFNFPVFYQGVETSGISWDLNGTVETVVLLSKGEVDSKKIRVEFSLEDMDMSEFQDGATYPQIKEYVLEHTGLRCPTSISHRLSGNVGLR